MYVNELVCERGMKELSEWRVKLDVSEPHADLGVFSMFGLTTGPRRPQHGLYGPHFGNSMFALDGTRPVTMLDIRM